MICMFITQAKFCVLQHKTDGEAQGVVFCDEFEGNLPHDFFRETTQLESLCHHTLKYMKNFSIVDRVEVD